MNPESCSALSARLRDPERADPEAERLALRMLLGHMEGLDLGDPAVLWRQGLGHSGFDLLLDYLAWTPLRSEAFEWIAADLREALLQVDFAAAAPSDQRRLEELAAGLALQAFRCEYVLPASRRETDAAAALESRLEAPFQLALFAAYRPLHALPGAAGIAGRTAARPGGLLELVLRTQVTEPLAEAALRPGIRALTTIGEGVSQAVRQQYEENPYPRWHRLPLNRPAESPPPVRRQRRLIAGCGTGQQPVAAALRSPHVDFVAVDLSLASLAYASRKAGEYGIRNLELAQADLLRLPETGLTFDAISCTGVLHHMERPAEGLRALRALMAGERDLEVAVYTESGRAGVVEAIRLREQWRLPATADGVREFRQMIYALPEEHPARQIARIPDFFSISGCRDLAFHVLEHRYTLPRFAQLAASEGLRVESVVLPERLKERIAASFPGGAKPDVDALHRFESQKPGCFGMMYRCMLARA